MALPKIPLSQKMMVLIAVPAFTQLGIIAGISWQITRQEIEVERIDHARQVHDSINALIKDLYRIVSVTDLKNVRASGPATPLFGEEQKNIYEHLSVLKELLKSAPKELTVVQTSEKWSLEAMAIVQQLKEIQLSGDLENRPERRLMVSRLRRLSQQIISEDLINLANAQADIEAGGPIALHKMNTQARWFTVIGGLFSLLMMAFVAIFLLRKVAARIDHMVANTENMAKHRPLFQCDLEGDEISHLDQTFHDMSKTIDEMTDKQAAVVDNAGDMICSMDENGIITSVNVAGSKLFACHQADLIGKTFRDLVYRQDAVQLSNYLQLVRAEVSGKPVQLRLITKNKRILYVLWSAKWTSADNQYFSVIRDLTKLQEAQIMKQEVLAIISKDLQTPLTNIQNFIDLLEEGSIAQVSDRGGRFVSSAKSNINKMSMLINDMVDLEKAKGGLMTLNAEAILLDQLIDKAQTVVAPLAEAKSLILDCRRSGLTIKGEEDKLLRVLINLLEHSVLNTPRETTIQVLSKKQDSFAQITINHKGFKTAKDGSAKSESLSSLFDLAGAPANDNQNSAEQNGHPDIDVARGQSSSLALPLCKAFVELHGGTIGPGTKGEDGTTISLTLPLTTLALSQGERSQPE